MTTPACPQAVLDYLEDSGWEPPIEPLHAPASIAGKDINLQNIWAYWMDEGGTLHAVDYTNDVLKEWVFTNAYPVKDCSADVEENGCIIHSQEICLSPIVMKGV